MKKEKTIRVLKIEPGKEPYEKEISNDLKGIQSEVEGLFELLPVLFLFAEIVKMVNLFL